MTTTTRERDIRVAVRRIEGFAKQYGEAHRNLARHAAFPLVLTPDLLYQIWANFVPEAPWTAVAHVLLSRLCRQVGYEMYEIDIADRNLLLRELKEQFEQERLDELGEFLLDYVAQRLTEDDADTQDLREAQEWTALAYTRPDEAARELAEALSLRVKQQDMTEVFRLTSLVETFAEPLAQSGFEPLLIYTDGMRTFICGNQESAAARFAKLPVQRGQVEIAGVSLDIPLEESAIPPNIRNEHQTSEQETGDNELRIEELSSPVKRVLILAANPKNSTPLRLDQEVREIGEALRGAKNREQFELKQEWAVRPKDMRRAMLEFEPHIVHFSGHGAGEDGLALENEAGEAKLVSAAALAAMFELAEQVECVLLNACYSEVQGNAIAQHIPYVIGMNQAVGDQAALEFAVGFYDALGAGRSFERAFKEGCISIQMAGIAEHLTPVLKQKANSLPVVTPAVESPKNLALKPIILDEPEGQIPLDSAFYVERPPIESRCYEAIAKPGALIRIKAPRQMGKSSLMLRILNYATEQGYRATSLNLQSAGGEVFSSLDQFLHWLCSRITRKLNVPDRVADYWQGALGSNDKCTDYFELYLLPTLAQPLALCLDEVDEVFKHPAIARDFFGLLRAWHEESKINPVWGDLRLVITHSKEVYIPLNINQSPFNVGVPIELPQLNWVQVEDLIQRHGLNWKAGEVEQLIAVVGGHPYLLRVALYHMARGEITLERLRQIAPTEEWVYGEHLRRHLQNLENANLLTAMQQVVVADAPVRLKTAEAFKLASMGVVQLQGNDVVPLCGLYRQYFRERLGTRS